MAVEAARCYNGPFTGQPSDFRMPSAEYSDLDESSLATPSPYGHAYAPYQQGCYSDPPEGHYFVPGPPTGLYPPFDNPGQFYHQPLEQVWVPPPDYPSYPTGHPPFPASSSANSSDEGELVYPTEHLPVHAPVPVQSGFQALPSPEPWRGQVPVSAGILPVMQPAEGERDHSGPLSPLARYQGVSHGVGLDPVDPVNFNTFPTPSELLTDLTAREAAVQAHTELPEPAGGAKVETQRKARQRVVAENVGFVPTDPDTISSHDKKRHYLECLEQYVLYLHEQFRLLGQEPVQLERVSTYRGLSSRSIRTLLVHMQEQLRKHHDRTLEEEQIFGDLRDSLRAQEAAAAAQQFRRRSAP
ncbi:hypothetical protein GLOTRDRAFT_124506 [Gloeophyllum trabeum ATCC 11539]|uniref:Uncharacterized protein n=1 Tax=Gloeophyllum trabeum (strain ATCC 11539 / FP-39264 / Madison 617) TaxID=670483 RepID=S7QMQ9_GLOTA|nr:uncharacterized protein GLOTRDRAFT_124506 [Gloeophyllum trabeum ATCC 11539]EPQ60758.1 hypothetical protein GLOTRDRAFT_124506 [Gloeophyllum trabeum ATCC 11539]